MPTTATIEQMLFDVGFYNIDLVSEEGRAYGVAERLRYRDITRAGLSVRDVK